MWGHRFEQMVLYRRDHNKFQVNFSAFHSTYEVDTPLCSAKQLDEYLKRSMLNPEIFRVNIHSKKVNELINIYFRMASQMSMAQSSHVFHILILIHS